MMKKIIILLSIFCISCVENQKKTKNSKKNSQEIKKEEKNQPEKQENTSKEEKIKLDTQNAIPFLFEFEKKNPERFVKIETTFGAIEIELFKETPYHRANFIFLAKNDYFEGVCFHRVVKNFIIQGGNADSWEVSRKRKDIGFYLLPPDTKKGFKHHRGVISMPSSDIDNPHQFASPYEFFIVCQTPGAYHLDKKYTAFGRVLKGMEVVDKINALETDQREWPLQNVLIKKVSVLE